MSDESREARTLRALQKNVVLKGLLDLEMGRWEWVRKLPAVAPTRASRRLPRSSEDYVGFRATTYWRRAVRELPWPIMRVIETQPRDTPPLFPLPSPVALVLLVGDDTPKDEIKDALDRALPLIRRKQRLHGGHPRRTASQRLDRRLERAILFLWLNSTKRSGGRPLGPERIGHVWHSLTEDWSTFDIRRADEADPIPASLHQVPQAWLAWVEWGISGKRVEDLGKDAVRTVLKDLPVYAPVPDFTAEVRRILRRGGALKGS